MAQPVWFATQPRMAWAFYGHRLQRYREAEPHAGHAILRTWGFTLPLLIGGATTSRAHTAVKIAPGYSGPVVYVPDASRSVTVTQSLLSAEARDAYVADVRADYEKIRRQHAGKKGPGPLLSIERARQLGHAVNWAEYAPPVPAKAGLTVLANYPLEKLVPYIDWGPFFQTWELSGPYPKILDDPVVGVEARKLLADAQAFLRRMIEGRWVRASGVCGLFPAARAGHDDIAIYRDPHRREAAMTWHNLRQQNQKPAGHANLCLADFVAPRESGVADWVGAFAVTAGLGIEKKLAEFERAHDDYAAIMLKSLADRLAEAFAEHLHERVRREYWGYAPDETLDSAALIAEKYRGIRPAPGYPACPDHTDKAGLFALLDAPRSAGMTLTESYAMLPAAAVAGFYLSHPDAAYFAVGKVGRDQVQDYARRKGMTLAEAERWLAPYLAYEPEAQVQAASL
jgi:5-methyltetrahydrofolate--homocysteine methyltransferase